MYFPSFDLGAATSSNDCSPQNLHFYTAPSSPMQPDIGSDSNDDEFEFVITTRRFANPCEFQQDYPAFWWTKRTENEEESYRLPARAKSFCSGHVGHVLPLRPPPGLQTSVYSLPRSPNSLLRIPFSRPCAWNDDFDPFQFALEKVSDETRARMSFHRRSHSYSSYRTSVSHWLDGSVNRNEEHHKQGSKHNNNKSKIFDQGDHRIKPREHLKPRGPTLAKMMAKESLYSRRVVHNDPISKPKLKSNPMARTKTNGVSLGKRATAANHEPMMVQSESSCCEESKIHRLISLLFKSKKGSNENRCWKLRRCLGYAPGSPPFVK